LSSINPKNSKNWHITFQL